MIALGVVAYKGFQVKMIGDEAFNKVGLSSSSWLSSCEAGMGEWDLTNHIVFPTKDLVSTLDENWERFKWNLHHPESKRPEINIDRLEAEYKQTIRNELQKLVDRGRETATQGAILAALFLTAALLIRPRKNT